VNDVLGKHYAGFVREMERETPEEVFEVQMDKDGDTINIPVADRFIKSKRPGQGPTNRDLKTLLLKGKARLEGMKEFGTEFSRRVTIRHTGINLTEPFSGEVKVKVELSAKGTRHEYVFAQGATITDPAARLAIYVTGQDAQGRFLDQWPIKRGMRGVEKVNEIVDWLEK
jgi:hypothetical protein